TASAAFRRLRELLGGRLAGRVRSFQGALGREAIWLEDGGSIQFIARSKSSGRGFTADLPSMDEAQELSDDALAALRPTMSAAPLGSPQQILAGTPPSSNMNSDVFKRMRDSAIEGSDPALSWHEWSAPDDA